MKKNDDNLQTIKFITHGKTEQNTIEHYKNIIPSYSVTNLIPEQIKIPTSAITVVCGKNSHGKTQLMANLFVSDLIADRKTLFITLEEDIFEIAGKTRKIYTASYGVDNQDVKNRFYNCLQKSNIIGQVGWTIDTIEAILLEASSQKFETVYIDCIQKIRPPINSRAFSRQLELAEISSRILSIATSRNLAVILGAQLNREKDRELEPIYENHIRESGDIAFDANLIIGIQRFGNKLFLNTAKNRNGEKDNYWILENQPNQLLTGLNRRNPLAISFDEWKENCNGSNDNKQKYKGRKLT
jgi:predicted ATP-dependent serine protease